MSVRARDRTILRDLAKRVAEIAVLPEQAEKARLWKACNDLQPERAMVYADPQGGWQELDEAWMRLECEDGGLRRVEHNLRRRILRHEYIPDDYPITDRFDVGVSVAGLGYGDYGLDLETVRSTSDRLAYRIVPAVQSEADLAKLHPRPVRVDHEATGRRVAFLDELLGDLLRVRKRGLSQWRYGLTRVLIHMRGLENMMIDMFDNPRLLHQLMTFLRDSFLLEIDVLEEANAVSVNGEPDDTIGTGGLCAASDLPGEELDGSAGVKHCACWGESQESVGIGPKPFDEFVLAYQLPILQRFRLVAYGCCEHLDQKYDLLFSQVANLRWVAVPPMADPRLAAEKIGDRYVLVYKPNPSRICVPAPAWEAAERDIRETLEVARGCAVQIVMKDTSTFCDEPERVSRWAELASRVVREMG